MIKTRNQNKLLKKQNQNKPKPIKKPLKNKKQKAQTDVEEQNVQINQNKKIHAITEKPKKSVPKFVYEQNLKDNAEQYEDDIIKYVKGQQAKYKIDQNYLKYHSTLNVKNRIHIVKYIFKSMNKHKCKRSTLYLAVFCFDFYLSKNPNLQNVMEAIVVAQASIFMAMKYEEIYPPELKELVPDPQLVKKILKKQSQILRTLNFKLNFPSVYYFEQYFQKKFCQSQKYKQNKQNLYLEERKINLIADLCLFQVSLYQYTPLELAKNIRMLVYNIDPPFNEERIVLNIKWAMERNKEFLDWLKEIKYTEFKQTV